MGLFTFFTKKNAGQFISEKQFKSNTANQLQMTPQTLSQLEKYGVTGENELKLEFFFYSNTLDKVERLSIELNKLNYDVKAGQAEGDKSLFIATGWTGKMKMDSHTVMTWTKDMCELGYKFDCEFDGWGTMPDQN